MSDVNVFDFDNIADLNDDMAAMLEPSVQENPLRNKFIDLLGRAPRPLTFKELYVAASRMGYVVQSMDDAGAPIFDEETGKQVLYPALSTVANWLRNPGYGAVQVSRGKYAKKGSDADNGERYEHMKKSAPAPEMKQVSPDDLADLGDDLLADI